MLDEALRLEPYERVSPGLGKMASRLCGPRSLMGLLSLWFAGLRGQLRWILANLQETAF